MSTALSIAFTGLCALIGDGDGRPAEILLLDARGIGEVGGITLPEHAPTLVVSLSNLANPESSGPTRVIAGAPGLTSRMEQVGLWDLTGSEVRIRAQGGESASLQYFRPSKDDTSWPEAPRNVHDPGSWRDLRFVPNMKAIAGDGRIDPPLVGTGDPATTLPRSVAARIHLDSGLLEATIPSQETYRDDVFEFRVTGSERTLRQALTDTIQWTLKSEAPAIVIDVVPLAGGPAKRLLLGPSAVPHRIFISNLPAENVLHAEALHAMSDEEMGALHFGAYYKLLLNEPADKPLPKLQYARPNRKGAGLVHSGFCPPAIFSRQ